MKRIALTALFLALAVPAHADEKFDLMDLDKDGKVTWQEFQKAYPGMTRAAFDMIDIAQDGYISHEEWDVFIKNHQRGMNEGGGMGGSGGMPGGQSGQPPSHGGQQPLITPPVK